MIDSEPQQDKSFFRGKTKQIFRPDRQRQLALSLVLSFIDD